MIRHVLIKKEHDSQMPSLFEWQNGTGCLMAVS